MKLTIEVDNVDQALALLQKLSGPGRPGTELRGDSLVVTKAILDEPNTGRVSADAVPAAPEKRTRRPRAEKTEVPPPLVLTAQESARLQLPQQMAPTAVTFEEATVSSFLEDDDSADAPAAKVFTKDETREALVALQLKVTGVLASKGDAKAAEKGEEAAREVLVAVGRTEKLGKLPPELYGMVIAAANKAAAKA